MRTSKAHPHMLNADSVVLIVVDMQEPFVRNVYQKERLIQNISALMESTYVLRIPIIATTQNAAKMGNVIPEIRQLLPLNRPPFDKVTFSCMGEPAFVSELRRSGRRQVLLCGVESHICVSQTALEMVAADFQVHVVNDAVSSRTEMNWRTGLEHARAGRALITSVETALYEMLTEAETPEFREILRIVKAL